MDDTARPCFPWVGGKEKLIPYIQQVIHPNIIQYTETFGGSGAVLLGLPRSSKRLDIYNDLDGNLSNFFLCAKEKPLVLLRELGFLPFLSREIFEYYRYLLDHEDEHWDIYRQDIQEDLEVLDDLTLITPEQAKLLRPIISHRLNKFKIDRAAKFFVCMRGCFSGVASSYGVRPLRLLNFLIRVRKVSRRLQDVAVENKNALQLIMERDRPNGLIYSDPPYFKTEDYYPVVQKQYSGKKRRRSQKKMRRFHIRLWQILCKCSGFVIVSYNDCPVIRRLYADHFYILAFKRKNPLSQKVGSEYGELIITNYDPRPLLGKQLTLFDNQPLELEMELVNIPKHPIIKETF